ncbi:MAG: hypothetical protein WDM88_02255 [Galbitalea sp.]
MIHSGPAKVEPTERAASFPAFVLRPLTPIGASFVFQSLPRAFLTAGVRSRAEPPNSLR